jgi:succinate dehydrogenase/fumarate reductase cytochrome b subunit
VSAKAKILHSISGCLIFLIHILQNIATLLQASNFEEEEEGCWSITTIVRDREIYPRVVE